MSRYALDELARIMILLGWLILMLVAGSHVGHAIAVPSRRLLSHGRGLKRHQRSFSHASDGVLVRVKLAGVSVLTGDGLLGFLRLDLQPLLLASHAQLPQFALLL